MERAELGSVVCANIDCDVTDIVRDRADGGLVWAGGERVDAGKNSHINISNIKSTETLKPDNETWTFL